MATRQPKRRYYHGRPVKLGGWRPEEVHHHEFHIKVRYDGMGRTIIIDKCKSCPYEAARDLL